MTDSPQWSGEMLDEPELVAAFAAQLRGVLASHADYVARIRRDAEAMWDANPPAGYSTFESWWRSRWVKGPLAKIQEHLDEASKLTFKLEARYRRGRHEIPAARQAAKAKNTQVEQPMLGSGQYGRRTPAPASAPAETQGHDFMDLIQGRERSA